MGNQREIRQLLPTAQLGVAIPIRADCVDFVSQVLAQHSQDHFYTYIAPPNEDHTIPNMDFGETPIGRSRTSRFIIQSGGKMWCGYTAFCEHVASVAKHLEDARFFVGDEEDYIDQFQIKDGELTLTRVHSGSWRDVESYIQEQFPEYDQ